MTTYNSQLKLILQYRRLSSQKFDDGASAKPRLQPCVKLLICV